MVTDSGLVKVLDFGLAKVTEQSKGGDLTTATMSLQTEEGTVVGTAAYMSPEQAEARPVDARSDIFSFGAVLYEMVTGNRAFERGSRASLHSRQCYGMIRNRRAASRLTFQETSTS